MTLICRACHRTSEQYDFTRAADSNMCPRDTFPLETINPDPWVGTTVDDRWSIESCIWSGIAARVFIARDSKRDESVELQIYRKENTKDGFGDLLERWQSVNHPLILKILEYGSLAGDEQFFFVVAEYPRAQSLANSLDQQGSLSAERAVPIFLQIADALQGLIERGVFYTNVNPSYILMTEDSRFGVTPRLTNLGVVQDVLIPVHGDNTEDSIQKIISPLYRGREAIASETIDERTVVNSLGCLMYDVLTGLPPHSARTLVDIAKMHTEGRPLPLRGVAPELDIPPLLDELVLKSLEPSAEMRQQSLAALKGELIHACDRSRVFLPDVQMVYEAQPRGEDSGGEETGSTESQVLGVHGREDGAATEGQTGDELSLETRAELEKKIKDLRICVYLLAALFVVSVIVAVFK